MKSTLTALFLISSFNCSAVITAACPADLEINLQQFHMDTEIEEDGWNERFIYKSQEALENINSIKSYLHLVTARQGQCVYRDSMQNIMAYIEGSTQPGAAHPAVVKVKARSENYDSVIYIPISDVQPEGVTQAFPETSVRIYYPGEQCRFSECFPDHIFMGVAVKSYVR